MEKIIVENVELQIPEEVVEDFQVFKSIINEETWNDILSGEDRLYLSNFLPHFGMNDIDEKEKTLEMLFSGTSFKFGNPLELFHNNLKDGTYDQTVGKLRTACSSLKEKHHDYDMKLYYDKLLCEAVIRKQNILDKLYKTSASRSKKIHDHLYSKDSTCENKKNIHYRVNERCLEYLREIKDEIGEHDIVSSDDDDNDDHHYYKKISYFSNLESGDVSLTSKMSPHDQGDVIKSARKNSSSLTNNDFMTMMKKHKKRKRSNPKLLEFDTTGLSLDDIMKRADYPKKPKLSSGANKSRKVKQEIDCIVENSSQLKADPDELNASGVEIKVEKMDSFVFEKYGPFQSFFSLIKDFMLKEPGHCINLNKLEDKVVDWQECSSSLNAWSNEYSNWNDLVLPALKFLSGLIEGIQLDDFDPPVRRMDQIWTWKMESTCDDEELSMLYYHWMEQRNNMELNNSVVDLSAPVPPSRIYTDYMVRLSSPEEKQAFRLQELHRFTNPHRAFTYRLHGYESTVGPIKGIYSKESFTANAVKAREHALLINERPACVNILTLVHDSAARLPNGEGTRSDICELLKDSQFLGSGVTDAQINTIVSGALDRLHYERDPCVKYDNARKVWIYRHRHRTEPEFERIHQMQKTATKAKKLSCPKKGSLSKLQLSILKQKETTGKQQHGKNSSAQLTSSIKICTTPATNPMISSPPKFVKAPVLGGAPSLPSTIQSSILKQSQQNIHTLLQLPDGSIIKTSSSTKQPGVSLRMAKITSTAAGEKAYSILANRSIGFKSASTIEKEPLATTQVQLQSLSAPITSSLKTDANQLRIISQIQQKLLQQQKQQSTLVRASSNNLQSSTIIRPGIQCSTSLASLISNQKISGLPMNSNILAKTGTVSNKYVSHLLRGNTLVLPPSTSTQPSSNLQGLICVTIANSNLAQFSQGGLIRGQSSNVRVLSLPTKVLMPDQQHSQKNILIGNAIGQSVNQTLNPSAIYLAANINGKSIQDSMRPLSASSILNPSNTPRSLTTLPRIINPSISLLSPGDVKVAIMRPRVGHDQLNAPQVLQARLPTSLQGFFQIVTRPHPPIQTTISK